MSQKDERLLKMVAVEENYAKKSVKKKTKKNIA